MGSEMCIRDSLLYVGCEIAHHCEWVRGIIELQYGLSQQCLFLAVGCIIGATLLCELDRGGAHVEHAL